ncbi:FAD-dependent oxidoreductase [Halorutilales archaeon Cl-col2-1]
MADTDTTVTIIGDGPAGLSAALILAKDGQDVEVFGDDESRMHDAYLYNYPGIDEIHGSDFMEVLRDQCEDFDTSINHERVDDIDVDDDGFTVTTESGDEYNSEYTVLATGLDKDLAEEIGLEFDGDSVEADKFGRTSVDDLYAAGWVMRGHKIEAAISAGDGQAVALDILSDIKGEPYHDFDVP